MDETSFLVTVIDLHSNGWLNSKLKLKEVVPSLLVFFNAHLALNSANGLAVYGYNGLGTKLLYSTTNSSNSYEKCVIGSDIQQFEEMNNAVVIGIRDQIEAAAQSNVHSTTSVAGPVSLALTFLNKIMIDSGVRGHVLVLSAGGDDVGSKYIPTMNTVFTAQKLRVPLDIANFGPPRSFLQQAAEFTGGSYTEFREEGAGLVHFFNSVFLVEPGVRSHVNLATKSDVDFSAVCFVTKKILEIGFVCSVCLCIMDEIPESKKCPVCSTEYKQ